MHTGKPELPVYCKVASYVLWLSSRQSLCCCQVRIRVIECFEAYFHSGGTCRRAWRGRDL